MELLPSFLHYAGPWTDPSGKVHILFKTVCAKCNTVMSEMHHGCCGHASSGFGRFDCECTK